jgi:hypothetical protein
MKSMLLVVSSLAVLQASAAAGTSTKPVAPQKLRVAAVEKTEAAPAVTPVAPAVASAAAADVPSLPDLPADASSALVPFPELEKAAAKPKKAKKAPVAKLGTSYALGRHTSDCPNAQDTVRVVPKSLTRAQVATVVESHKGDIQLCLNIAPAAQRVNNVGLSLSITETGTVSELALSAGVPATARSCISVAVAKWSFPTAEVASEVEYAIALR